MINVEYKGLGFSLFLATWWPQGAGPAQNPWPGVAIIAGLWENLAMGTNIYFWAEFRNWDAKLMLRCMLALSACLPEEGSHEGPYLLRFLYARICNIF
jgi:hypothetical protein